MKLMASYAALKHAKETRRYSYPVNYNGQFYSQNIKAVVTSVTRLSLILQSYRCMTTP